MDGWGIHCISCEALGSSRHKSELTDTIQKQRRRLCVANSAAAAATAAAAALKGISADLGVLPLHP